ncbi:MAG: phosphatase PAP2 family protein [Alphaproteobacteria bacterium]
MSVNHIPIPRIASILVLCFLLASATAARAQNASEPVDSGEPLLNGEYWNGYWKNPLRMLSSPTKWSEEEWIRNGVVLVAAGGLFLLDKPVKRWTQGNRSGVTKKLAKWSQPFGKSLYLAAGMGGTYLAGLAAGDRKLRETALLGLESWFIAALFTDGVKRLTGRVRPENTSDNMDWNFFQISKANTSFPSGHATNSFAVATVFASAYEDEWAVQAGAYGLAALVSWSRVHDNRHWISDVFLGGAIGFGVGKLVHASDPFRRRHGVRITPVAGRQGAGVNVAVKF